MIFSKNYSPPDKEGLGEVVFLEPPLSHRTKRILFFELSGRSYLKFTLAYHGIYFDKTGELVFISIKALSLIGERANCKVKRLKKAF